MRRFCLECSKATGRLVPRIAPALERRREARTAARAVRRADEAAREHTERWCYTFRPVVLDLTDEAPGEPIWEIDESEADVTLDLLAEYRRLCRLRIFGGRSGRFAKDPPDLHLRRARRAPTSRLGSCSISDWTIHVTLYPGQKPGDALSTILHELVHAHERYRVGSYRTGKRAGRARLTYHDDRFKRTLLIACEEAFLQPYRAGARWTTGDLDRAVEDAAARWLAER